MKTVAVMFCALCMGASVSAQTDLVGAHSSSVVGSLGITARVAESLNVYGTGGLVIGEVDQALGADKRNVTALAIDFSDDDPLFGRGNRVVPVELFSMRQGRLTLSADARTLRGLTILAE